MKFGCNISHELLSLLDEEANLCDYIKIGDFGLTRSFVEKAFNYKPLLLHGFGWHERGGMTDLSSVDFAYMFSRLQTYKTPYLGMHALAFEEDLEVMMKTLDKGEKKSFSARNISEVLIDHMKEIFTRVSDSIPCELIIENMDYTHAYTYETTIKETVIPEFYVKLLEATGLNLLLDTSHAFVASYQLGMDIYEYLDRMPLDKVREIHFSGVGYDKEKGYIDVHGVMKDRDYEVAKYLASHQKLTNGQCLDMITLEYGTVQVADKESIRQQLYELKKIFCDFN